MNTTCISPESSYLASPQFLRLALHGETAISITAHFFGLYCILFKTPEQMKSVKWYFLNLHIWIICYDYSVCFLTVPVLLLPALGGYPLGILNDFGVPILIQTVLVVILLECVLISILAIFENRFHTVCTFKWKSWWARIRPAWLFIHYLTAFAILIPAAFSLPDQDLAKARMFEKIACLPEYIHQTQVFIVGETVTYPLALPAIFLLLGVSESLFFIISTVFIIFGQFQTRKSSPHLLQIQKRFFLALIIQMLVPLILLIIPLLYAIYSIFYNYYNQAITNIIVIMQAAHGMISTLAMIFIHRPYRAAFFQIFSKSFGE